MHRLPKGVMDPRRQAGRTELSQTNNYPSWSPSQEVTSTTSLNNSFQGLITFPCRKFFLSSQLSPSCCPVSPNGWVSFPSPTLWSQEQDRDHMGFSAASLLPHAVARLLGLWHGSDHDRLRLQPRLPKLLPAARGSPRAFSRPIPATGCCILRKLCLPGLFPVVFHAS